MGLAPSGGAGQDVVNAVLSAFDQPQLSALLRYKGGIILEQEVASLNAPFRRVVQDLVTLLDQNGDIDSFLLIALSEKPRNPKLQAVAASRGVLRPGAADTVPDVIATPASAPAVPSAPTDKALEKLVARRSRRIDFGQFQIRLDDIGRRTCLIRTANSLGTGFLVGPDLVLTNFHVVEDLLTGVQTYDQLVCEFDFNTDAVQTERVALARQPTVFSRYSNSDLTGSGDPGDNELDYALLPLADPIGNGDRRFYVLDKLPRLLARDDFLFVCQHAQGQMLALAMGTITDFPGKALRVRYDVTTDHGSSGSPCFDAELNLVGLHHAADPAAQPRYNQAVPTWLIARHAATAAPAP